MPVIKRRQVKLLEAEILTKAARFFVGGFVKYLDSEASRRGWSNEFSVECLSALVRALVLRSLTEPTLSGRVNTSKDAYVATRDSFILAKTEIRDAVSRGFQDATTDFSGKPTEYYCVVDMVPEVANKIAN